VPAKDYADGRAAKGYIRNAVDVAHYGESVGHRVARHVDAHHLPCRNGVDCSRPFLKLVPIHFSAWAEAG